mgnify:CR=1 FL=1
MPVCLFSAAEQVPAQPGKKALGLVLHHHDGLSRAGRCGLFGQGSGFPDRSRGRDRFRRSGLRGRGGFCRSGLRLGQMAHSLPFICGRA